MKNLLIISLNRRKKLGFPLSVQTIAFVGLMLLLPFGGMASIQQSKKLSLNLQNVSLEKVFYAIQERTGCYFIYNSDHLATKKPVSVNVQDASLEAVLKQILKDRNLNYSIESNTITISPAKSQQVKKTLKHKIVSGKVTDSKGNPLPGVSVFIKGTSMGVATDMKGEYRLEVPDKPGLVLIWRFIGMDSVERNVKGKGETLVFNIVMKETSSEMEEVVVTGIFNKAKESFTGAATLITKQELKEFKSNNLLRTLGNIDPSFNILQNNEYGSDPNKLPEINIRGTTSIPSNLEDLQAGERANLNTPLFILDGFEITLERMMDLDPEEIESITILKDASSTAIYGSRGSNGVVVLTSVKPEAGKLRVNVGAGVKLEISDLSSYDLLNAREKLEIERIAGFYKGENLQEELELRDLYSSKMRAVQEGVDTYWLDKPLQTGVGETLRLGLSGGDPAFRYSLTTSYNNNVSVMKGSYRKNFNGTLTINYLTDKISFANSVSVGLNKASNSLFGAYDQYVKLNPYWEMYDENGEMVKTFGVGDKVTGKLNNPLYTVNLGGQDGSSYTSIRNSTNLEWRPLKSFKVGLRFGISQQVSEKDKFTSPYHQMFEDEKDVRKRGRYSYNNSKSHSWNMDMSFSYAKVIKKHSFFIGADFSAQEGASRSYGMAVTGFTHDKLDFISMGSKYDGDLPTGSESKTRAVGFMTNFSYNFNRMLYLDANYRLDGASSFGEYGRFKPYYSVGSGWTISRFKFFEEYCPWLSNWRIRYSYGVSGSLQFSSPYDAMTVYEYDVDRRYLDRIGATIMGYGNPDLSWQYTYSHNVGMDLSLFNGRVSMGINYYRKKTEGMSTTMRLPLSHGYDSYKENRGDVENKGVDANVSVKLISKDKMSWTMRASIAHNRNKILKLSKAMKELSEKAEFAGLSDPNYLYREGESMDALYVVPSMGIDPNSGKEVYIDRRGNPTFTWQHWNRKSYGVKQPKVNARFSTSFRYKGLTLTASFSSRLGGKVYNSTLVSKVEQADLRYNVDQRVYSERWQKPGDHAKYQALNPELKSSRQSSRFVQAEKTFEFTSLNVAYNFGRKVLKFCHLKGANFSTSIGDIFYLSTVKRERGTKYPFSYKPSFSLSITI